MALPSQGEAARMGLCLRLFRRVVKWCGPGRKRPGLFISRAAETGSVPQGLKAPPFSWPFTARVELVPFPFLLASEFFTAEKPIAWGIAGPVHRLASYSVLTIALHDHEFSPGFRVLRLLTAPSEMRLGNICIGRAGEGPLRATL
jgi:hypothetical protein